MASADDPQKYIFQRTDFYQYREKNEQQQQQQQRSNNSAHVHPTQRAITDLFGEWPSKKNFTEIEHGDGRNFLMSLPFSIQATAAQEQQNLDV
eukprot:scaffold90187_cov31-Attheya_sp.AAC.1